MRILVVEDGRKVASFVLYLGGRSGKNRSLPRSDHAGERDRREGMFRQEGLYPVFYEAAPAVKLNAAIVAVEARTHVQ